MEIRQLFNSTADKEGEMFDIKRGNQFLLFRIHSLKKSYSNIHILRILINRNKRQLTRILCTGQQRKQMWKHMQIANDE